jgi:hypothetical protein
MMRMGPDEESRRMPTIEAIARQRGISGEGQIIGIADTGIDWDNCMFWDSAKSSVNPNQGQRPPQQLDLSRRKIIMYTWYTDCNICNRCPVDIQDDYVSVCMCVCVCMYVRVCMRAYIFATY